MFLILFNVELIYWSCYDSLIISLTLILSISSVVKETLDICKLSIDCQGGGGIYYCNMVTNEDGSLTI